MNTISNKKTYMAIHCTKCNGIFCGWENDEPVKYEDHPETIQEYIDEGCEIKKVSVEHFMDPVNECNCN